MRSPTAFASKALLLAALVSAAVQPLSLKAASLSLVESDGFCSGGGVMPPPVTPTWVSYCAHGDDGIGRAVTTTFTLSGPFELYLTGDPSGLNLRLRLENLSDHASLDIVPEMSPTVSWLKFEFAIPDSWRGKSLRLVAEDHSSAAMGWFGFSGPLLPDPAKPAKEAKALLLHTLHFAFLIYLPGLTFALLALSRQVRGTTKLGLFALAGIALPGYLLFSLYILSPHSGLLAARALPYLFGLLSLVLFFRASPAQRKRLLPLIPPLTLSLFASLTILSMGYLYGGTDTPNITAQRRLSHLLPGDNEIPYVFSEGLRLGSVPHPLFGDWLSSDRPPLQTGMILALEPWVRGRELPYHVASAIAQTLWILPLWLLLSAFRIPRQTTALIVAVITLSGFSIVNTFYVWPKLLAAAYMLAFAIPALIVFTPGRRVHWPLRLLMAFLLAASLLAHGGTAFALLGLGLFILLRSPFRRLIVVKNACVVLTLAVAYYSPWLAYQKFIDPPGDRLVKYHLAGVEQVTSAPALPTIYQAYRRQPISQTIAARTANIAHIIGREPLFFRDAAHFLEPIPANEIRILEFFNLIPTLGFNVFGILAFLCARIAGRRSNNIVLAQRLFLWSLLTAVVWLLLMFKPFTTNIHAGAYAMVLATMAASILAFRAIAPRLALAVCLLQICLDWSIYYRDLSHPGDAAALSLNTNPYMELLHFLSLAAFLLALFLSTSPAFLRYLRPRIQRQSAPQMA